jgi:peptidyl-tRNA hydrolase
VPISAPPGSLRLSYALRSFVAEHPEVDREWFEASNVLVLLEVPDERSLIELADEARSRRVPVSLFREPDIGDAATALALGPEGRRLVSRLPLAMAP